jgi:hypothetical protein
MPLFLALALAAGAHAAPAPATDQEAWNLAVQVSDQLQPSEKLLTLMKKMVGAARAAERAVEAFQIPGPGWGTTSLIVSLEEGAELGEVMGPFAEDLKGMDIQKYSFGNSGVIKWENPVNVRALQRLVEKRPGVKSASLNSMIGLSSSVSLQAKDGGYRMTYFAGSGDCPAGCIHKKFWKFRFDGEGNLIGQEVDDGGPKKPKAPGLGIMPAPGGGGPAVMPEVGPGLGLEVEPPEDPNADVEFPSPGRPGTYQPKR